MLVKYYFKIKYIKAIDNTKADILSKKVKLQSSEKLLNTILCIDKDRKIKYNYLKLTVIYKAFILN
jgi:hypothetical protein